MAESTCPLGLRAEDILFYYYYPVKNWRQAQYLTVPFCLSLSTRQITHHFQNYPKNSISQFLTLSTLKRLLRNEEGPAGLGCTNQTEQIVIIMDIEIRHNAVAGGGGTETVSIVSQGMHAQERVRV